MNKSTIDLSHKILSITDVLRGIFRTNEYAQVILPFILLRRLDALLEDSNKINEEIRDIAGDLPFCNTSKIEVPEFKS